MAEQISAEACAWVAQLDTGNLSRADIAALKEWVSRSPAHVAEIQAVARLSGQMGEMTEFLQYVEQARLDYAIVRARTRRIPALAALAVISVFAGVLAVSFNPFKHAPSEAFEIATQLGEHREHTLSDGSVVKLNTNTRIEVAYSKGVRDIYLLTGEALFDVAPDSDRPFIVYAGNTQSEALGTTFSLKLDDEIAELSVLEGVVSFSPIRAANTPASEASDHSKVILNAGQIIALAKGSLEDVSLNAMQIRSVPERELLRRLSWTEGLLEFSDTPLAEVVEEINRYIERPLRIGDERLYDLRVGGIYRTEDKAAMLEALERFGIDVDRSNPDEIVLNLSSEKEDTL